MDNEIRVSNSTKTASWQNGGREKQKHEKTGTNKSQTVGHITQHWLTHVGLFLFGTEGIRYLLLCIPLLLLKKLKMRGQV